MTYQGSITHNPQFLPMIYRISNSSLNYFFFLPGLLSTTTAQSTPSSAQSTTTRPLGLLGPAMAPSPRMGLPKTSRLGWVWEHVSIPLLVPRFLQNSPFSSGLVIRASSPLTPRSFCLSCADLSHHC